MKEGGQLRLRSGCEVPGHAFARLQVVRLRTCQVSRSDRISFSCGNKEQGLIYSMEEHGGKQE